MARSPVMIACGATATEAEALVASQKLAALPIVDESSRFLGMVSLARLRQALEAGQGDLPARDFIASKESIPSDEPLLKAVVEMSEAGLLQLAVVHPDDSGRLVGMLAMSDVLWAQARGGPRNQPRATAAA